MMESNRRGIPNLVYCNLTKRLFDPTMETNYGPINEKEEKEERVWFEVVKDDHSSVYRTNPRKIDFNKININFGNSINRSTKQFSAPISGWYQFSTNGRASYYQSYIKIKTMRNDGETEHEDQHRGGYYNSGHTDSFRTTTFSRYLKIGEKIEIWEYGYKFRTDLPFRFNGYLVPEAKLLSS